MIICTTTPLSGDTQPVLVKITPFPIVKRRRGAACLKVKVVEDIPVYCLSRMPELPDSIWVECSPCKEWYHSNTGVKISEEYLARNALWQCPKCDNNNCTIGILVLYFTIPFNNIFARNVWFVSYGKL